MNIDMEKVLQKKEAPKKVPGALFYGDVYKDVLKLLGLPDNMYEETLVITLTPESWVTVVRNGKIKVFDEKEGQ